MTIITDLHALKSIFKHLLYERGRDWPSGEDMSWQIEWLESYIEQLKNSPSLFACPRCDGTGAYDSGFDVTRCRACAGTGRQTKENWKAWCDKLNSGPTLAQQLGKRCPDCTCGATEQDWKQRCHWRATGLGLSLPVRNPDGRDIQTP